MSIICFIFGHKMPGTQPILSDTMRAPAFTCRECGDRVRWDTMPKQVQAIRAEYLRRTSTTNQ